MTRHRRDFEVCADGQPTEQAEQRVLAEYLDLRGFAWCWVPNGGNLSKAARGVAKAIGLKAGVPDILIFQSIPFAPSGYVGLAIELKRQKGKPSDWKPHQKVWAGKLQDCGWATAVGWGATESIKIVEHHYGVDLRARKAAWNLGGNS